VDKEAPVHAFGNIVIFHPAAIGDAVLATPVAKTLKLNYPGAKITYWSHSSLKQLLFGLCPSIDDFVEYSKDTSFFEMLKTLKQLKPDLFVDLSNSRKGTMLTFLHSTKVLRYLKERYDTEPSMHAVDNFMQTIAPVCHEIPKAYFPTIFPEALAAQVLPRVIPGYQSAASPMIGIVPGVGQARPHRAWLADGWQYLLKSIIRKRTHVPVLIGGEDEVDLCAQIEKEVGSGVLNLAGKLALTETAAILKSCQVVISGDTGPAHIAVAVGTPVIGLHGPTSSKRSGPYGFSDLAIDQSSMCKCLDSKYCQLTGGRAPGECMERIMLAEIIEKIASVIPGFDSAGENEVTPEFIEGSYM
jgi:ADP-heptose:LPS heptosyltransferase